MNTQTRPFWRQETFWGWVGALVLVLPEILEKLQAIAPAAWTDVLMLLAIVVSAINGQLGRKAGVEAAAKNAAKQDAVVHALAPDHPEVMTAVRATAAALQAEKRRKRRKPAE